MKTRIFSKVGFIFMIIFISLLVGCNNSDITEAEDIRKLVNDYSLGKIEGHAASIDSHQLKVTKSDESQVIYDYSKEDFFVSIAPYEFQTHP